MRKKIILVQLILLFVSSQLLAQQITTAGKPAELILTKISDDCLRVQLVPIARLDSIPDNPALKSTANTKPFIRLRYIDKEIVQNIGNLCPLQ